MITPRQGAVYGQYAVPERGCVVVSNSERNSSLPDVLVAPIVEDLQDGFEAMYRDMPSVVSLGDLEPVEGFLLLDFISLCRTSQLQDPQGHLSDGTMRLVRAGIAEVFDL